MNGKGFGMLGVLLVIIVLVLVSGVGVYVYRVQRTSKSAVNSVPPTNPTQAAKSSTNAVSATVTPVSVYAGWKTATLQYEKIAFKYPASWKLVNTSYAIGSEQDLYAEPGIDTVSLTTPNGEELSLQTGVTGTGAPTLTQLASMPISVFGDNYFLSTFTANGSAANTASILACVSLNPSEMVAIQSKNIVLGAGAINSQTPKNRFCFMPQPTKGVGVNETAAALQGDKNFVTAKLVLESMKYL